MVEKVGVTFDVATDSRQALEHLAQCIHGQYLTRPDIIFMDEGRGTVYGPKTTHIIRTQPLFSTDPKTNATPIIALTRTGIPPASFKHLWPFFVRDGKIYRPIKMIDVLRALKSVKFNLVPVAMVGCAGNNALFPGHNNGLVKTPIWGPQPLRKYPGPRALL
ncbi:hypothetical protein ACJ72_06611 [Emergomyces africanus]|uniref:Response regulatory domain-containing protein n=1 Tax=Emergomyces africanus TaxID=1955775 RepID=A0A1B7NQG4_9EURO|nr:hypothetical protein ACJ72_06611 [Emergomyces africanus]